MKQRHTNQYPTFKPMEDSPRIGSCGTVPTKIKGRVGRFMSLLGLMLLVAVSGHVPAEASQSGELGETRVEIDFSGENVEQLMDGRWIRSTAQYRGQTFVLVDRSPTIPEQPRGKKIRIFLLSKHKADGSLRGKTWAYINGHKYIATDNGTQSASAGNNQRG